eukprot:TRINITY_DN7042_c0_g4_i1.p1 TRINITY_DN7042_c0_g4~~TRINITY_DN7042_c0_g4_i1.p1  ORF type:complete len:101 (-),score=0.53 TRINITY_DN7042_c0_g4_i1:22-324(-)
MTQYVQTSDKSLALLLDMVGTCIPLHPDTDSSNALIPRLYRLPIIKLVHSSCSGFMTGPTPCTAFCNRLLERNALSSKLFYSIHRFRMACIAKSRLLRFD